MNNASPGSLEFEGCRFPLEGEGGDEEANWAVVDEQSDGVAQPWSLTIGADAPMRDGMGPRRIRLRYASTCAACSTALAVGTMATWDSDAKAATCDACAEVPIERGAAGVSAAREADRRRARREARVREAHPRVGGLILKLTGDPQRTRAWAAGSAGEAVVGSWLDSLAARGVVTLHDRRVPRTRANIDHIAVAPSGVYVIDAKQYSGQVHRRDVGTFFRRDERLFVGRRDCSKLIEGVLGQAKLVRAALGSQHDVPVHAGLAFVAEWSLLSRPFVVDGVWVGWPKALATFVDVNGSLDTTAVDATARRLAEAFPPAGPVRAGDGTPIK